MSFLLLWLVLWSLITSGFDGFLCWNTFRQLQAYGFAKAPGVITECRMTEQQGDEGGVSYGIKLKYTYRVGDQRFAGDRIRYLEAFGSRKSAERRLKSYAAGSEVKVYYNGAAPHDALLEPGLSGSDLFMALFLTPFNLIMVGGWAIGLRARAMNGDDLTAANAASMSHLTGRSGALPAAVWAGGITLLALSFVSIFAVGIPTGGDPSLPVILTVWGLIAAATLAVFARKLPLWSGEPRPD